MDADEARWIVDTIAELRAENERLKAALTRIGSHHLYPEQYVEIAREALGFYSKPRPVEQKAPDIGPSVKHDLPDGTSIATADLSPKEIEQWAAASIEHTACNHWPGQKRCGVCGMGFGPDESRQ